MKDFIRENGRTIAIIAAAAMILSLIIGLFTRNSFGVALLRAIFLALLFAFFAAAILFTLKKYLPELAGKESPARAEESDAATGHAVDIVLPEEPMVGTEKEEGGVVPESQGAKEGPERYAEASSDRFDEPDVLESVDAVESLEAPMTQEKGEKSGPSGGDSEDGAADLSAEGSGGSETGEATDNSRRTQRDNTGGLDTLPDFGFLGESAKTGAGARASRLRARKPEDAARDFVSEEDPESLAKAIRTVIKRDEKG